MAKHLIDKTALFETLLSRINDIIVIDDNTMNVTVNIGGVLAFIKQYPEEMAMTKEEFDLFINYLISLKDPPIAQAAVKINDLYYSWKNEKDSEEGEENEGV